LSVVVAGPLPRGGIVVSGALRSHDIPLALMPNGCFCNEHHSDIISCFVYKANVRVSIATSSVYPLQVASQLPCFKTKRFR
jgi:hypothetical protein